MEIISVEATNFGSFKQVFLSFENLQGAIVIEGDTGAGKSTLLDIVAWGIYGETSKATKIDEVRQWGAEESAIVKVIVKASYTVYTIVRIRGAKNDLYLLHDGEQTRGINLKDTQTAINNILGLTYQEFLSCSYFTQFSDAEKFFTDKPSARRELLETLVDTSLAQMLGDRALLTKKTEKGAERYFSLHSGNARQKGEDLDREITIEETASKEFEAKRLEDHAELEAKLRDIQYGTLILQDKQKSLELKMRSNDLTLRIAFDGLSSLKNIVEGYKPKHKCPACSAEFGTMGVLSSDKLESLKKDTTEQEKLVDELKKQKLIDEESMSNIKDQLANFQADSKALNALLTVYKDAKNSHAERVERLKQEKKTTNDLLVKHEQDLNKTRRKIVQLDLLYDISIKYRGAILGERIHSIQTEINRLLVKHFDAELKLGLFMLDGDSLEIKIERNGNECSFKALSGGQRCILKLCLWLAIKKAIENKKLTQVNLVMLDESLHGLSDRLKQQAYGLIEEIAHTHPVVLVVDHNEGLKSCFSQKITVYQKEGHSLVSYE